MKALIIVDMLNDFVDGKLENPKAQEITPPLQRLLEHAREALEITIEILRATDARGEFQWFDALGQGMHDEGWRYQPRPDRRISPLAAIPIGIGLSQDGDIALFLTGSRQRFGLGSPFGRDCKSTLECQAHAVSSLPSLTDAARDH